MCYCQFLLLVLLSQLLTLLTGLFLSYLLLIIYLLPYIIPYSFIYLTSKNPNENVGLKPLIPPWGLKERYMHSVTCGNSNIVYCMSSKGTERLNFLPKESFTWKEVYVDGC